MSTEANTYEDVGVILSQIAKMTDADRSMIRVTLRTETPSWVLNNCRINWIYIHDTNLCQATSNDKIRVSVTDDMANTHVLTWNRHQGFNWGGEIIIDYIAMTTTADIVAA